MKRVVAIAISVIVAIIAVITVLFCVERIPVGNVGVVYSARGVEDITLSQGWHFISPLKSVKEFPISQWMESRLFKVVFRIPLLLM